MFAMNKFNALTASLKNVIYPLTALFMGTMFVCCAYASLGSVLAFKLNQSHTPTTISGIILALYYLGSIIASFNAPKFINKVGHIRSFAVFASLLSVLVLGHAFSANRLVWVALRLGEGFCIGSTTMCLESWINTRANNKNRGMIISVYMVTSYLGASLGQLFLNIPDKSGTFLYMIISILFSLALMPVSLTTLPAPSIQTHKSMSYRKGYAVSPVGFICCITSGILVGTFYMLGAIYASNIGLDLKNVSMFMFFGVMGGLLAQFPLGKLSDTMDRRYVLTGIACFLVILAPIVHFMVLKGGYYLIISTMLLGAGTFTLYPISVSHVNDLIPDEERINASGMLILTQNIGLVSGPILVSGGMSLFGPFFFMAAFAIIPALFILFTIKKIKIKPDINYLNVTPTQPIPTAPANTFNELAQDDTLLDKAKDLITPVKE